MKTIKSLVKIIFAIGIMGCLISCDDTVSNKEQYIKAYNEGYSKAISDLNKKSQNIRSIIKEKLNSWFTVGSLLFSLMLFFGSQLFEWIKKRIVIKFDIPVQYQILGIKMLFILTVIITNLYFIFSYSISYCLSVFILTLTAVYFFFVHYIDEFAKRSRSIGKAKESNKIALRLYQNKILSCFFVIFIIAMTYHFLQKGIQVIL